MPSQYTRLPNQASEADPFKEMDDAFESDDEDTRQTTTPLAYRPRHEAPVRSSTTPVPPGTYDFEREYDVPPPGSPPRPSAVALPNDYGNSNGLIPTGPVEAPIPRPSFLRRAVGAILPTYYTRLPAEESSRGRTLGGGTENDGVFANVMAKPSRPRAVFTETGEMQLVPEETQKEAPPVSHPHYSLD